MYSKKLLKMNFEFINRNIIKHKDLYLKYTNELFKGLIDKLPEHENVINEYLNDIINEVNEEKEFCKKQLANGQMCSHIAKHNGFCGKHIRNCEVVNVNRIQCTAVKPNGEKCIRTARQGHSFCGHHINLTVKEPLKQYYCIATDDEDEPCDKFAKPNSWVCGYHKKKQISCRMFYGNLNNHQEYMNLKEPLHIDKASIEEIRNNLERLKRD